MVLSHHSTRSRSAHTTTTTTINGTDIGEQNKYTNEMRACVCAWVWNVHTIHRTVLFYTRHNRHQIPIYFIFVFSRRLVSRSSTTIADALRCVQIGWNEKKYRFDGFEISETLAYTLLEGAVIEICDHYMRLVLIPAHRLRVCEAEKLSTVIARCQFSQFDSVFSEIPKSPLFSQFLCGIFVEALLWNAKNIYFEIGVFHYMVNIEYTITNVTIDFMCMCRPLPLCLANSLHAFFFCQNAVFGNLQSSWHSYE